MEQEETATIRWTAQLLREVEITFQYHCCLQPHKMCGVKTYTMVEKGQFSVPSFTETTIVDFSEYRIIQVNNGN